MPPDGNGRTLPTLALVGQLGLIMAACLLGGLFLGVVLDRKLHSTPVLTILLILAGVAAGMMAVYRLVMKTVGAGDDKSPEEDA